MRWSVVTLVMATAAVADDGWEKVADGKVTVKTRAQAGTAVREVLAEGDLDATALDVQAAILSADRYATFMPYVKESRYLTAPEKDGSLWVYTRLNPPVVSPRDWVVKSKTLQRLDDAGSGMFVNEWRADGDRLPARAEMVRLKVNQGSWRVTPLEGGRCHVVYQFTVDPGGFIPSFVADLGNRSAVPDTFAAVEREAKRLAASAVKVSEAGAAAPAR